MYLTFPTVNSNIGAAVGGAIGGIAVVVLIILIVIVIILLFIRRGMVMCTSCTCPLQLCDLVASITYLSY